MNLVLVAAAGVVMWLSIVSIAIVLCRAAARADARAERFAGLAPVARL
jgi:biopolymer transport protein ExbB/TolQ